MKTVDKVIQYDLGCYIKYDDGSYDQLEGVTMKDMYRIKKGKKVKTFEEIINERLNILNQKGDDLVNVRY
jgi:hypothetical protein